MKALILGAMVLLLSAEILASNKAINEKYLGSCDIVGKDLKAHFSYSTDYVEGDEFSEETLSVELQNSKKEFVPMGKGLGVLSLSAPYGELDYSFSSKYFTLKTDSSMFGGIKSKLRINLRGKSGYLKFKYKCWDGNDCGQISKYFGLKKCNLNLKTLQD